MVLVEEAAEEWEMKTVPKHIRYCATEWLCWFGTNYEGIGSNTGKTADDPCGWCGQRLGDDIEAEDKRLPRSK